MTLSELLDAYVATEAALFQNSAMLMRNDKELSQEEAGDEGTNATLLERPHVSIGLQIKEHAARLRQDLESSLLSTPSAQKLLQDSHHVVKPSLQEREVRGQRVRMAAQGGVATTWKRSIQRNLNVHWANTLRHFMLFLFFGYFGGRTPFTRAILLLGAPSVFLLQARPVKLWLKQALYLVLDHPPSIFLSLLPAPEQVILSLDVKEAMEALYGDMWVPESGVSLEDGQNEGWLEMGRVDEEDYLDDDTEDESDEEDDDE
jgi:hypothetical protein